MSDLSREFALSCAKCGSHYVNKDFNCANCEKEQGRKDDSVDMVNHPPHYKDASGIECIEVTKHMSFLGGNCFKYLYRAGSKGDAIEDLKKAAWYADRAQKNDKAINSDEWRSNLKIIAQTRNEQVKAAMLEISIGYWYTAGLYIENEIQRLENMDVD